ncbi:MAG: hypothetical protein Q7W13_13100 [Bacteroidia bacterium]|nr:hypothetical protein [Bacteroidia bacterium]
MEKIILIIIFIAGLYHSVEQWKNIVPIILQVIALRKRGYHPEDYPYCVCERCKDLPGEEKQEANKKHYTDDLANVVKSVVSQLIYAIFTSGLSLIILFIIFN